MTKEELEKLRKQLNEMIEKYDCGHNTVLELSRELDILIMKYLRDSDELSGKNHG